MRTRRSPRNQERLWKELGRQIGAAPAPKRERKPRPLRLTRSQLEACLRVTGYHGDRAAFTRLIIENRINRQKAQDEYRLGEKWKQAGWKCACRECNP